jgi:uncharacterized membrane protein
VTGTRALAIQLACWLWIAATAAYFGWEYTNFTGLYRWLADQQIAVFGKYALHLTALLPFLVVSAPAFSIIAAQHRRRRQSGAAGAAGISEYEKARSSARILFLLAPVCFAIALGAFLVGQGETVPDGDPVRLDLSISGDATPPSGRVTLVGDVLVDKGLTTLTTGRFGQTVENFYAPVIGRGRRSDAAPFHFFVKRSTSRSTGDAPLRQMFLGQETGILIRDGLPSDVEAMLVRAGAKPAEPYWLLTNASARSDTYYAVAGVSGVIGTILLLGSAAGLVRARIRARRKAG